MKATIMIRVPKQEWEALGEEKPAKFREGIQKVTEHPELLGKVVSYVAVQGSDDEPNLKTTTVAVEPAQIDILDKLAKRLATTRNSLFQIILKGILRGVV